MISISRVTLLALALGCLVSGCGKRELNLSVKAADSERDQPTAALVRQVQLTYHTPAGHEGMRETIPVLGLSQPVSVRSDLLKGVEVEEGGTFEARGYTSEGLLMLRGIAQAHDDSSTVEIAMGRDGQQPRMAQPLLRRVRLANVPTASGFDREAKDLVPASDGQAEKCTELPGLKINSAGGDSYPKLILEGAVKAPSFQIEVGVRAEKGLFKRLAPARTLPINPAGDAELELGRDLLDGALLKHAWKLMLRLHSSRYEGCFEVTTHPEISPVQASVHLGGGAGYGVSPVVDSEPAGYLDIYNPNLVPMRVDVTGVLVQTTARVPACGYYDLTAAPRRVGSMKCSRIISATFDISGGSSRQVGLYAVLTTTDRSLFDIYNGGFRVQWSVNAVGLPENGGDDVALPTQSFTMEL